MASVPDPKYGDNLPERGARLARREERAYREYVSDEQRRQAGCPARQMSAYFGSGTLCVELHNRPHLDAADARRGDLLRHLNRVVQVLRLDQVVAAQLLLRLGKRAV